MVLFVDRHTRLIIGFFVKQNDEATAIEIIKQFIKDNLAAPMFKWQDFIFLQSDNGEFHKKRLNCTHGRAEFSNVSPVLIIA